MEAKSVKNASSLLKFSGRSELENGLLNFNAFSAKFFLAPEYNDLKTECKQVNY